MGDSEKMIALKKAYAEIILNTAKEAAARVMVAERKAVRYQRELGDVKDDAVRMMLRLKQMMDFKIHEADVAASRQQSKIDELEAQLHEAEDIVKDLREELTIVRDELDYMRKNRSQQISEQEDNQVVTRGQEAQREDIAPSISGFEHSQVLKVQTKHVAESEMGNLFDQRINASIPDGQCENLKVSKLASNVPPTKELGSLVNGSSQRIHKLTNENLSNEDCLHGKSHFVKDDSTVKDDCENSGNSVKQTTSPEVYVSERKSHNRTKQEKKTKKAFYLAVTTNACKHAFKKSKKSSSSLRKSQSLAENILKSLRKTYLTTSKAYPCPSSAMKETDGLKHPGLLFKAVELCSDVGLNEPIQPCSQSTPENDKLKIVKVSTGEENGSADSSVTCADPETACVLPSWAVREEPEQSDADDAFQPKTDRSIKYTFQRKRKKECIVSADENNTVDVKKSSEEETLVKTTNVASNGNDLFNGSSHSHPSKSKENTLKELKRSLKRMNVDKQVFKTSMKHVDGELPTDIDPKVIGIVPKATRDSRRLRQVARQLLSMSEKKWWD